MLTALASTTFPNGALPEVIDVVRVAANLFAAGQETTVRLLGATLQLIAERPELQRLLRERPELIPNFVEETLRIEAPVKGDFRLARRRTTVAGVDIPAGATMMVLNGAANRDPRHFDEPVGVPRRPRQRPGASRLRTGRPQLPGGIAGPPGDPGEHRAAPRPHRRRSASPRSTTAPPDARRYQYMPTYILRGLTQLHLEFTTAPSPAPVTQ